MRAFTAALAEGGITASDYNTPDHEPDGSGLQALFKSLFSATPPTALIFEVAETAVPAFTFLALRGLAAPRARPAAGWSQGLRARRSMMRGPKR